MRAAVLIFPGSNCDRDMEGALTQAFGRAPARVWWKDATLPEGLDLVAVPGGFSFGDYLRSGAIAARAPAMRATADFAARGGLVLGVCNGFQVLTEAGLLPGVLMRNAGLRFLCKDQPLEIAAESPFTGAWRVGETTTMPLAHHDGCWIADPETRRRVAAEDRVAFRYVGGAPNGSQDDVAGVLSENRRILGLMPHPERAVDPVHGGVGGRKLFESLAALAPA
ncbi:MAG TPA: phosphoribosylformylglycinamidine synthase subunit PurQ [Paracoccaceae bacterium]|nr:phosphoribosylformylglycinamidine synthase subunit PurQ [Paracoccaceae bacterium]